MKQQNLAFRSFVAPLAAVAFAALLPLRAAIADTVLIDNSGFIQGQQSFVQSLDITSAGTLTVSLSNIPWLDTISDLNFFLTTSSGAVAGSMGIGTTSVEIQPGTLYAHWYGDADGKYGAGIYGLDVTFQPQGSTVPLPPAAWLMVSGLLAIGLWLRRPGARAS
jgi:hypothetical protein